MEPLFIESPMPERIWRAHCLKTAFANLTAATRIYCLKVRDCFSLPTDETSWEQDSQLEMIASHIKEVGQ